MKQQTKKSEILAGSVRNSKRYVMKFTGILALFYLGAVALTCCNQPSIHGNPSGIIQLIDTSGMTIQTRFRCPEGFSRKQIASNSFGFFLRNSKLLPATEKVHLYNGELKSNQQVHAGILDVSVGKRDLQQCADAVMRLRAEYLFNQKKYSEIHFHFVSGFDCKYEKWLDGYRLKVQGNQVSWVKTATRDASYPTFLKYMETVFNYASTLSLEKELSKKSLDEVEIGDVLIQGGSPGHAVIVVDMIQNESGQKRVLLAQSYMPAQQIHVLKNPIDPKLSPWIDLKARSKIYTPEWTFESDQLREF
jgi:hypothetical protein